MLTRKILVGIAQLDGSERHPGLTEETASLEALDETHGYPRQHSREPGLLDPNARVERVPDGVRSEFGAIGRTRVPRPRPDDGCTEARVVDEPFQHPVRPSDSIVRGMNALLMDEK